MKLKRLILENFRGKKTLDIELGSRMTLLLAANGGGKTSILDGIAIGLGEVLSHLPLVAGLTFKKTGDIYQTNNKIAPYARIVLHATNGIAWDRMTRRDKSATTTRSIPAGLGVKALRQFLDESIIDPLNSDAIFNLPIFTYYGVSRALLDVPLTRKGFTHQHARFEALANALNADSPFNLLLYGFITKKMKNTGCKKQRKVLTFL